MDTYRQFLNIIANNSYKKVPNHTEHLITFAHSITEDVLIRGKVEVAKELALNNNERTAVFRLLQEISSLKKDK